MLEYAAVSPVRVGVPAWLRWAIALLSLPVIVFVIFAIPPKNGAIDYTQTVKLADVAEYFWRSPDFQADDVFVLVLMTVCVFLILFARNRRMIFALVIAAYLSPGILAGPFLVFLPLVTFTLLPSALAGRESGEEWSEGFVCGAALGLWQTIWLIGGALACFKTRNKSDRFGVDSEEFTSS